EMSAMRQRMGPFEVLLTNAMALDTVENSNGNLFFYTFEVVTQNDKLTLHGECTLTYDGRESLVTITELEKNEVTIRCEKEIRLGASSYTLVIYPWFLYEKLKVVLESLLDTNTFHVENALTLFGKIPPLRRAQPLHIVHTDLNRSQRKAVQLCSDSNLAFVWGPPGTGKTTTLGHIVTELLRQGNRILITSTTNAAVDQALAKLSELEDAHHALLAGQIVRVGQTDAATFGASLNEVKKRLNTETAQRLEDLRTYLQRRYSQIKPCDLILEKLKAEAQPQQLDLFGEVKSEALTYRDLIAVFSEKYTRYILRLSFEKQRELVTLRKKRLEKITELCRGKISQLRAEFSQQEKAVVQQARVVLATMTNMYISSLLNTERFDVVIVEEAAMAILPILFYCAALAKTKVIIVGDKRQLPPIVQSRAEYVHRAMGRNIFEVTVPDSYASDVVVMLDIQYRMHPAIGELVSTLFYDGKLRHAENTNERIKIANRKPYSGEPLIVVDTESRTTCETEEGGFSRFNENSARLCVDLTMEAIGDGIESVAIITPYVSQSRRIRQLLSSYRMSAEQVHCSTVHRFQGNERDLVIFDTVDASPLSPGVLLSDSFPRSSARNLINVSLSRARGKLII
ncbi:MAG: DEAD/DEAH box helicase, partial [Candidatus Poribacteria bacterium]